MSDTPQRERWSGPAEQGTGFILHNRDHEAVCKLRSHPLGWEVVLDVDKHLSRSQVCRTTDEVLGVTEAWERALVECGWE